MKEEKTRDHVIPNRIKMFERALVFLLFLSLTDVACSPASQPTSGASANLGNSATVTVPSGGQTYYFRIRGYNQAGNSPYTAVVAANATASIIP